MDDQDSINAGVSAQQNQLMAQQQADRRKLMAQLLAGSGAPNTGSPAGNIGKGVMNGFQNYFAAQKNADPLGAFLKQNNNFANVQVPDFNIGGAGLGE